MLDKCSLDCRVGDTSGKGQTQRFVGGESRETDGRGLVDAYAHRRLLYVVAQAVGQL